MDRVGELMHRAEQVLERLEAILPQPAREPDWTTTRAWRWRTRFGRGALQGIAEPRALALDDLRQIDRQKALITRNVRQFMAGLPANDMLLWGARGTGKSSLAKALLNAYGDAGLRLVEVDKEDLVHLPEIVSALRERPERFMLFCDDLSFDADDGSYKALKATLDGSLQGAPDNVLLCVTSNRRHLLPEYMQDNRAAHLVDGELHHGEAVEEKISLSERFGLWVSFHPFSQDDYLAIVGYWLDRLQPGLALADDSRSEALRWALSRGSRSGRVAWQFACDWVGRHGLQDDDQ